MICLWTNKRVMDKTYKIFQLTNQNSFENKLKQGVKGSSNNIMHKTKHLFHYNYYDTHFLSYYFYYHKAFCTFELLCAKYEFTIFQYVNINMHVAVLNYIGLHHECNFTSPNYQSISIQCKYRSALDYILDEKFPCSLQNGLMPVCLCLKLTKRSVSWAKARNRTNAL